MLLFECCCFDAVVSMLLFQCCCFDVVVSMLLFQCCCLNVVVSMLLFECCCRLVGTYTMLLQYLVVHGQLQLTEALIDSKNRTIKVSPG